MEPPPNKRKRAPPARKKIKCPVQHCDFEAHQHQQVDIHLDENHICRDCNDVVRDLALHNCQNPGARVGDLGPRNLRLGKFVLVESAHRGVLQLYRYTPAERIDEVQTIYNDVENDLTSILTQLVDHYCGIRIQLIVHVRLEDVVNELREDTFLTAPSYRLLHVSRVDEIITMSAAYQIEKLNEYNTNGSTWQLAEIYSLDINCAPYVPLVGRGRAIPLPQVLAHRRAVISFNVDHGRCFHISICVALHFNDFDEKKRRIRSTYDGLVKNYKFDGIPVPVSVESVPDFELMNEVNVNVYGHKKSKVHAIHISSFNFEKECDLILLTENDESHFGTIIDFNKFMGKSGKPAHYYCKKCLQGMTSPEILETHKRKCQFISATQIIDFPKPGTKEALDTFDCPEEKLLSFGYGVFDFESLLVSRSFSRQDPKESWTEKIQMHAPSAYSFVVFTQTAELIHENYFDICDAKPGEGIVDHFLFTAEKVAIRVLEMQRAKDEQIMSGYELQEFLKSMHCRICGRSYNDKIIKVKHHQHNLVFSKTTPSGEPYVSNHLFDICSHCNLKLRYKKRLTILAHGMSNYDGRLILKHMKEYKGQIKVINKNGQTYMQILVGKYVRILDFLNHMPHSLRSLVNDLRSEGLHKFRLTRTLFPGFIPEEMDFLILKQFFCYGFMKNKESFNYDRVPDKKEFFNDMTDEEITPENYAHVQAVWALTNCKTMRDYCRLYCRLDTFLLSDVILSYVENNYRVSGIDPLHSISGSSYGYKVMRWETRDQELQRITQRSHLAPLRDSIRGGLNFTAHRLAYSNIPCHNGTFDPTKPLGEIFSFDVNQLYAWAQMQFLPVGGYRWLDLKTEKFDLSKYNDQLGAIVVCDLSSPQDPEWQRRHGMLPLAPEKFKLCYDNLGSTQQSILKDSGGSSHSQISATKLMLTFWPHFEYSVYAKELQFYLSRGMVLNKVHRVLEFRQADFMKEFITKYIDLRNQSTAETMKNSLKLLLNSIFGRWIMNVFKYVDVRICRTRQQATKYLAQQNYKSHYIVNDGLSVFIMRRNRVKFLSLYPVGCAILSLSKLRMYELFYLRFQPIFPEMKLLGGDTDSICIYLPHRNGEKDLVNPMKELSDIMDWSNVHPSNPLYNTSNKGKCGNLKNELGTWHILAYACHSAKMYKYLLYDPYVHEFSSKSRSKGIPRIYLNRLAFNEFRDAMFNVENRRIEFSAIRGNDMELNSVRVNKKFLSSFFSHRYLCDDKISTLAWGDYRIKP